jgi:hypothetical protein
MFGFCAVLLCSVSKLARVSAHFFPAKAAPVPKSTWLNYGVFGRAAQC